jgi:2,3-dihydroxybiphenyl 1,2-dioxygenase
MSDIVELGYVTVGVTDPAAFKSFATEVVGCQVGEETADEILFRHDWSVYRIRALRAPANDILAMGWCMPNEEELDAFEEKLKSQGLSPHRGSPAEAAERRVRQFIALKDPDGITVEIFAGLKLSPSKHFRSPLPIAGFVTGDAGMGHIGIWTDDLERSVAFYRDHLGMKITDRVVSERLRAAFLRCNHRQHSIALVQTPGPGIIPRRLHHIELEMCELDDVGRAYDLAEARQIVMITLGKHPAEQALSFYMHTPAGFAFELSWGGIHITDDRTPETWHNEDSLWGHRYLGGH